LAVKLSRLHASKNICIVGNW